MNKIGKYEFVAEPFHCDFSGRMFLGHLGNQMLNAADFHSTDRGFGMKYLMTINRSWVLSRLAIEMENFDKMRQELLELFIFCNQQKKLHFDSNPAFTDIDFDMLNQHLYTNYHIFLSAADRRTLNTVGSMINHIIYRLKDGNSCL